MPTDRHIRVPHYLTNGWAKTLMVLFGIASYIWTSARWSAQVEEHFKAVEAHVASQYDMVSYQIAEADKRHSYRLDEIDKRVAKVEGATDASGGWRASVINNQEAILQLLKQVGRTSLGR